MSCSVSLQNLKKGNVDLNWYKTCGHISDYLHCSYVNVTCLTGYNPVYEEDRCQKGYNLYYTSENDETIKNPLVNRNLKIIRKIYNLYLFNFCSILVWIQLTCLPSRV